MLGLLGIRKRTTLASAAMYEVETNEWQQLQNMHMSRDNVCGCVSYRPADAHGNMRTHAHPSARTGMRRRTRFGSARAAG